MQILSYNVNGIRAAIKNGLVDWLADKPIDILCFQEVKATPDQVDLSGFEALGYKVIGWHAAEKKGYSGVAILSKIQPDRVVDGCGLSVYDCEGRILRADFGAITLLNCYFPSGTSGEVRQGVKMEFLEDFHRYVNELRQERPHLIICGDYNIAHTANDIHDPVRNKNTTGFLPEERAWMTQWFASGFTDAFRYSTPTSPSTAGGATGPEPAPPTKAGASTTTRCRTRFGNAWCNAAIRPPASTQIIAGCCWK